MTSVEPPDPADERIGDALRSLPTPAPPPDLDRRVWGVVRRRQAQRAILLAAPVILAFVLVLWQPWAGPVVRPEPMTAREIPPEDLAVLFAPPPVDGLNVLAARNDVSVAALGRLEGVK
jgi:hypothetical protein